MAAQAQASAQPQGGGGMFAHRDAEKGLALIERRLARIPKKLRGGISERELTAGSREAEKRAGEKLDKLRAQGDATIRKVDEVGAMIREVAAQAGRKTG